VLIGLDMGMVQLKMKNLLESELSIKNIFPIKETSKPYFLFFIFFGNKLK
jgi:hypothetical protein